jgi:general secretion pathway protein H
MSPKAKECQGFTLMEMVVVLAIFAIVTLAALPYATRSGEQRELISLAQTLTAGLREAQMEALAKNREAVFGIDLNRRVFVAGQKKRETPIPASIGISVHTASGEVTERIAGFRFFPDGGATGGRIVLSSGGEKRTVAINWLTGQVVTVAGDVK